MQGMLYYLTKSDALFPAQLDGSQAQKSIVWSDGKTLSTARWKEELAAMHQQYPVIVFSKVSFLFSYQLSLNLQFTFSYTSSDTILTYFLTRPTARKHEPVFVFSGLHSNQTKRYSKRAKAILAKYPLKQTPKFIEADIRRTSYEFSSPVYISKIGGTDKPPHTLLILSPYQPTAPKSKPYYPVWPAKRPSRTSL